MRFNYKWNKRKNWLLSKWPLRWKKRVQQEIGELERNLRRQYKEELNKNNEEINKLMPFIVQAKVERDYKGYRLYITSSVDPRFVHQMKMGVGVDQQLWDYIAEMMGYELAKQLRTMNFSQIKVMEPKEKYPRISK